jgi:hypothetical protein
MSQSDVNLAGAKEDQNNDPVVQENYSTSYALNVA